MQKWNSRTGKSVYIVTAAGHPMTGLQFPSFAFNPLIATLKPQSNEPSYINTAIGTLAVDGWAVTFGTVQRGGDWRGRSPARPLRAVAL